MRYHDGVRPTSRGKSLVEYDPEIEMNWHTGVNFRKNMGSFQGITKKITERPEMSVLKIH